MEMRSPFSSLLNWSRLARISGLPSAISNILAGYLLAQGNWSPTWNLSLLILCSSCLFLSGMILNDFFDFEIDIEERPQRPLPAGQILKQKALGVGVSLIMLALVVAGIVAFLNQLIRPFVVAILLATSVLLYDGPCKKTLLAPILMGACRAFNVLLGASTYAATNQSEFSVLGFPVIVLWVAISLGVFITGVTLLAKKEINDNQRQLPLVVASFIIGFGLAGLAFVSFCPNQILGAKQNLISFYPLMMGLIAFPMLRRLVTAVFQGTSKSVQLAVVSCLRSIIILDAAVCFLVAPDQIQYALIVISLLLPALVLSRVVPPT